MKKRVERLRGMFDLLPEALQRQRWVKDQLGSVLTQAGYTAVDTPVLERSDLFGSSFGQDLWQKLYSFRLQRRELCLRPEYTASISRLYLDHYQHESLPLRFQYAGPIFRHETSERARYSQQTQVGVELFGGDPFATDAEILQVACEMLRSLQISRYRLELGHIGVASNFINRLQLDNHAARLLLGLMEQISRSAEGERGAQERLEALYPPDESFERLAESTVGAVDVQARYVTSLLDGISISFGDDDARKEIVERFLWKMGRNEQRRQIQQALEFLKALHAVSGPPPAVFEELRDLLNRYGQDSAPLNELQQLVAIVESCDVPQDQIVLNLSLGRDVSYYTGLVFEIHAQEDDSLDTQLGGGGRYDHLIHAVGGSQDVNACGFAFSVERLLSLLPANIVPSVPDTQALVIPATTHDFSYALQVARTARSAGLRTEVDVTNRGVSDGLRLAESKKIRLALIVGEAERAQRGVKVRDLVSGEEHMTHLEVLARQFEGKE